MLNKFYVIEIAIFNAALSGVLSGVFSCMNNVNYDLR